jgi:hypothetical protein
LLRRQVEAVLCRMSDAPTFPQETGSNRFHRAVPLARHLEPRRRMLHCAGRCLPASCDGSGSAAPIR